MKQNREMIQMVVYNQTKRNEKIGYEKEKRRN